MEKAWYWKTALVLVMVVGSALYLLPTFFHDDLPDWYTGILSRSVNLGLDLQGGSHLVLGVEVDKALEDKADQYVRDFKEAMKDKRIDYRKVFRVPGTWAIQFELKDAGDRKKLNKRILEGYYNLKEVDVDIGDERVLRMSYREDYVELLRRNARDQTLVTMRNRVDEFGVADPTIMPHGDNDILVQLPGMFDPERAKSMLGRTAQLEFRMVDDESSFIRDLKDKLPEGIRMEAGTYKGPEDRPVTHYFLIARGEGNEGRNRLLNFFNNATEIEQFLNKREVDPELTERIIKLVRGGLTPLERNKIMKLASPALGGTDEAAAASEAGAEKIAAADGAAAAKGEQAPKADAGSPATEKVRADRVAKSKDLLRLEKLLQGKVPEGREIGFKRIKRPLEVEFWTFLVRSEVAMTGDYITDAQVQTDEMGHPEVSLVFDRTGATIFEKLTGDNTKKRMAIVLEGEVASAPTIQTRISGGRARITLGSTQRYDEALDEAQELAKVLRAGALPAPVRILEERTVGPSMGEDARRQGTWALAIGMVLVVFFMAFYYRISGLVADIALILNAVFILTIMAAFQANLTLPGIAGIILTIGMAVDANVIINERIREELHSGKTPRAAVDAGYSRAFWTIFDASFTTMIAAVVLWSYGSGPLRGFAITLFIGILASMFTAIFVTRLVVDWLILKLNIERLSI